MSISGVQVNFVIGLIWIIWWCYWFGSVVYETAGGRSKRVERRQPILASLFQGMLLVIALILVITTFPQNYYPLGVNLFPGSTYAAYIGIAIAVIGIGFAIWARQYLGSNWSSTVELKKGHTLVTTGPYSIVRHPIYVGITLGIVGSAIAINVVGGLIAIVFIVLFSLFRILDEEKLMRERFGKAYEAYSRRTKAFIPLIL